MLGHIVPRKPKEKTNAKRIRIKLTDLQNVNNCQTIKDIDDKIRCFYSELAKIEKNNKNFISNDKYINLMNELKKAVDTKKANLSPVESVTCDANQSIEDRIKCIDDKLNKIKENDNTSYFRNPTYASLLVDRNELTRIANLNSSGSITDKHINTSPEGGV